MPELSLIGQQLPASPIRKLVPFAERAKSQGKKVFHLNIGQPDIFSPEQALQAVQKSPIKVLEYSHSAGNLSYREGLSNYYQKFGIDVTPEEILVTTGGSEALLFAFLTCFNPGDEVIIPEPFYANYNSFALAAGVRVVPVATHIEQGFALPSASFFEDVITPKTKGILLCNPGNPTGVLYSKEELNVIRELVLKHDLYLMADEVYREFVYDGVEHTSILTLPDLEQHALLVDSVSKRYSMCGARIGALVTHNHEVYNAALKLAQARLSPPTLAQIAAEGALDTTEAYFDDVKEEYRARRDFLVDGLNTIDGVVCPKPSGAFYCVAALPVDDAEDFCIWMLDHFELNGETVMMAPASGFYSNPNLGKNQVRIAYVLNLEELKRALNCLKAGIKAYQNR